MTYTDASFWEWVDAHMNCDPIKLRLEGRNDSDAVTQVECRKRFGRKLAFTLKAFPDFYFPSTLSGEQCTGDLAATVHQRFVLPTDTVVDLTAGLGIDAFHLARCVKNVTAVERDAMKVQALLYNAKGLGLDNIRAITGDCRQLLPSLTATVAFIDPARRDNAGGRVYGLKDCEPDVTEMLPDLRQHFQRLIVKASPMLDVSNTIAALPGVSSIYTVGTTTECKELDAVVNLINPTDAQPEIHAVTVFPDGRSVDFSFTRPREAQATANIARTLPRKGEYLYEPFPATMKAAPVNLLSQEYNLFKFHANTHLYFGTELITDFPGEAMVIVDVIPWQSKNLKRFRSTYPAVSVTVRNFGMSAEALRDKLGVKQGGDLRLYGIGLGTRHTDRVLVVAKTVTQGI